MQTVDEFRATLEPATLALVDALREIVASSHERLSERIKWNAPSFEVEGDDRITLGIERKGGVRVVLHRGAKPKDASSFAFEDSDRLARWPSPDRGVVTFTSLTALDEKRTALADLCRRWVEQTT